MAAMTAAFEDFIRQSSIRPFEWGENDCMLEVADWIFVCTGIDAGKPFRGLYGDKIECRELLKPMGGLVRAMKKSAQSAGLFETKSPRTGDIGLIRCYAVQLQGKRWARFPMGGIMMPSGRWRVRAEDGHYTINAPAIVAWDLQCQPSSQAH